MLKLPREVPIIYYAMLFTFHTQKALLLTSTFSHITDRLSSNDTFDSEKKKHTQYKVI